MKENFEFSKQDIIKIIKILNIDNNTKEKIINDRIHQLKLKKIIRFSYGVTKMCLIFKHLPFVIKWDNTTTYKSDSCKNECDIYDNACKWGIEQFFPKTNFFININGVDFYIQQKITCSVVESYHSILKKDMKQFFVTVTENITQNDADEINYYLDTHNYHSQSLENRWLRSAILVHGKKACYTLCDFLLYFDINDLSGNNLGYYKHKPMILDFCGYHPPDKN